MSGSERSSGSGSRSRSRSRSRSASPVRARPAARRGSAGLDIDDLLAALDGSNSDNADLGASSHVMHPKALFKVYRAMFPQPCFANLEGDEEEDSFERVRRTAQGKKTAKIRTRKRELVAAQKVIPFGQLVVQMSNAGDDDDDDSLSMSSSDSEDEANANVYNCAFLPYETSWFANNVHILPPELKLGYKHVVPAANRILNAFESQQEFIELKIEVKQFPTASKKKLRIAAFSTVSSNEDVGDVMFMAQELAPAIHIATYTPNKDDLIGSVVVRPGEGPVQALKRSVTVSTHHMSEMALDCRKLMIQFSSESGVGLFRQFAKDAKKASTFEINLDAIFLRHLLDKNLLSGDEAVNFAPLSTSLLLEDDAGLLAFAILRFSGNRIRELRDRFRILTTSDALMLSRYDAKVVFAHDGGLQDKKKKSAASLSRSSLMSSTTNLGLPHAQHNDDMISRLPMDVRALVFSLLEYKDLLSAILVCKLWFNTFKKHEMIILCSHGGFFRLAANIGIVLDQTHFRQAVSKSVTWTFAERPAGSFPVTELRQHEVLLLDPFGSFFLTHFRAKFGPMKHAPVEVFISDKHRDARYAVPVVLGGGAPFSTQDVSPKHTSVQKINLQSGKWTHVNDVSVPTALFCMQSLAKDKLSVSDMQLKGLSPEMLLLVPFWRWLIWDARANTRFRFWSAVVSSKMFKPRPIVSFLTSVDWDYVLALLTDSSVAKKWKDLLLNALCMVAACQALTDSDAWHRSTAAEAVSRLEARIISISEQPVPYFVENDGDGLFRTLFLFVIINSGPVNIPLLTNTITLLDTILQKMIMVAPRILSTAIMVPLLKREDMSYLSSQLNLLSLLKTLIDRHYAVAQDLKHVAFLLPCFLLNTGYGQRNITVNTFLTLTSLMSATDAEKLRKKLPNDVKHAVSTWILEKIKAKDLSTQEHAKLLQFVKVQSKGVDSTVDSCVKKGVCTITVTGQTYTQQGWYSCRTCWNSQAMGCCLACAKKCHAGHSLSRIKHSTFYCDCASRPEGCLCSKAPKPERTVASCVQSGICTFVVTGEEHKLQNWYNCSTCFDSVHKGCCESCATKCHSGHELSAVKHSTFFCDCSTREEGCTCLDWPDDEEMLMVSNADDLLVALEREVRNVNNNNNNNNNNNRRNRRSV